MPAGLTRSQKIAATKLSLKVFSGERDGFRFIAAVSNVTEFRRMTKLPRWAIEGVTYIQAERAIALDTPRVVLRRPVRELNTPFQEVRL